MKLSKEERETIIRISDADELWDVYSSSPKMMRKLDRVASACEVRENGNGIYAKCYQLHKNQISIRKLYSLSKNDREDRIKRVNSNTPSLPQKSLNLGNNLQVK